MSRLPVVSSDGNAWGTILNDFLSVAHAVDGTLKNYFVNLKDYCAIDGTTDDSTGFTTAYALAASSERALFHPGGTLIKGNDTLLSNVPLIGVGAGLSIIKLKNGANADLFSANVSSINLAAASATGPDAGASRWGLRDITLDGNKANQTSTSYVIRAYALDYVLEHVEITNAYSDGMLMDWDGSSLITGGGDQMIARLTHVNIHDCGGAGLRMGGPHDSQLINVLSWNNGSHGFHIAPNANGILFTQCHPYHLGTGGIAFLIESGATHLINCLMEGSDTAQVVFLANDCSIMGGEILSLDLGNASVGIQLGQQAGQTPYLGQIRQSAGVTTAAAVAGTNINTRVVNMNAGALDCANESYNVIHLSTFSQTIATGGVVAHGHFPDVTDMVLSHTWGLPNDFSLNTEPGITFGSDGAAALIIKTLGGSEVFRVNPAAVSIQIAGAAQFFSGSGAPSNGTGNLGDYYFRTGTPGTSLQRLYVKTASAVWTELLAPAVSATAVAIAASGTIATAGIDVSRVAPTGNVASVILAAGTVAGQVCKVVNESAFTVTFATAATSNVADGVSAVIAANRKMDFTWDSSTSRWYHS